MFKFEKQILIVFLIVLSLGNHSASLFSTENSKTKNHIDFSPGNNLGIKGTPANSNTGILIGFQYHDKTGFMIVRENQKFYNFMTIFNTISDIAFGVTLSEYPKILKASKVYAKDLVVGDRLMVSYLQNLNVMRVEKVFLDENSNLFNLLKNDHFVFWDLSLNSSTFGYSSDSPVSFMKSLSVLIPAAITASMIEKSIDKHLLQDKLSGIFSHSFLKYMSIEIGIVFALKIISTVFPEKTGKLISKSEILSRFFASQNMYPIDYSMLKAENTFNFDPIKMYKDKIDSHLAKIDFVNENELTNSNSKLNSTNKFQTYSEILVRTDGTTIKDRNGKIARFSIQKLIITSGTP